MADIRRYAFKVKTADGDFEEYSTAGDGLMAEDAVERAYERYESGAEIVKVLRGHVPDFVSLEPDEPGDEDEEESVDEPKDDDNE